MLEEQLGENLFKKAGRNLELTETGRLVLSYADEIFSLGGELEDAVRNLPSTRYLVFKVGVADVVHGVALGLELHALKAAGQKARRPLARGNQGTRGDRLRLATRSTHG